MSPRARLRIRELAFADIEQATRWYATTAGLMVATSFAAAVQHAIQTLEAHPEAGSPRWAAPLKLDRLRCCRLRRFPYLLFYRLEPDGIEVWRLLHAARDIPASFAALNSPVD